MQSTLGTTGRPVLRVSGLRKTYGRTPALRGISFAVPPGSLVALLGPNGAGKTTAFKCILGITGFEGRVEVEGLSPQRNGKEVRRRTGYLPQSPTFNEHDSCAQVLEFLAELRGADAERAEELLERVGLDEQRDTKTGHLSGGMRQRLALAAALLSDPALLLLDEPTANLDADSRRQFHDLMLELKAEGKAILLSTHVLESLDQIADRVVMLERGEIVLDAPVEELVRRPGGRRFVVNLNGTDHGRFLEALEHIGIERERITPAAGHLEEAVARAAHEYEENQR